MFRDSHRLPLSGKVYLLTPFAQFKLKRTLPFQRRPRTLKQAGRSLLLEGLIPGLHLKDGLS